MATTQTIDATIFASSHPDIAKRTSVSGVLISSVMLLVGILAFASTFELEDKSSTVSMALMVLGTGLFLMGIFRLFWKSKEVIYLPTKSVAKEHSIFFDLKHMDALRNLVNSGSFSAGSNIKSEASGNKMCIRDRHRQEAIHELSTDLEYRQQIRLLGLLYKGKPADTTEIKEWANSPSYYRKRTLLRILPTAVTIINFLCIGLAILGIISASIAGGVFVGFVLFLSLIHI